MRKIGSFICHGFRSLVRSPTFLVVSTIVLGVSLGNQIAISSLVDSLLVAAPSAVHPEELAFVGTTLTNNQVSHPDLLDLQQRITSFSGTFGYSTYRSAGVVARENFVTTSCTAVSGSFFPTLGVRPWQGRLITEDDDHVSSAPVAVLTAEMRDRLDVQLGDSIRINNEAFTVVGVLPKDYRPIDRGRVVGVWLPISKITPFRLPQFLTNRGFQWIQVGGRLKPGVSLESANAELKILAAALKTENARVNFGMDLFAQRYTTSRLAQGGNTRTVLLLYAIAWLLSGLAFVNFAALAVLRMLSRRRELTIRMSIGATWADISWPLLVELMSVCVLAVGFGLGFATLLFSFFKLDPGLASIVRAVGAGITPRAVLWVLGAVLCCGMAVWALAMRYAYQPNLSTAAREGHSAPHRQWASMSLYAVQFAIVFCLAVIAIAILGDLREIQRRALPFRTENVLMAEVNTSVLGLASNRAAKEKFLERCLQTIRSAPGVLAAGAHTAPPLFIPGSTNLIVDDKDPTDVPDNAFAYYGPITSGYFEALGVRTLEGRTFTDADFLSTTKVVVINRAAARRFWPNANAVGNTFKPWPGSLTLTIIGVVDDLPTSTAAETRPQIFLPYPYVSSTNTLTFAIHVREDSKAVRAGIQDALKTIWPDVSVPQIYPISDQVERSRLDVKLAVRIALMIAAIAAVVIGFGLYFFSAYSAAQTLRQSAIRLAIGASPRRVLLEHLWSYRWAIVGGAVLGLLLLFAARGTSDLVPLKSTAAGLQYSMVAILFVVAIALIGLCMPLRSLYRISVYRVLTRSD